MADAPLELVGLETLHTEQVWKTHSPDQLARSNPAFVKSPEAQMGWMMVDVLYNHCDRDVCRHPVPTQRLRSRAIIHP